MKQGFFVGLTIVALPLLMAIYFADRFVSILLPLADVSPLHKWMFDAQAMTKSIIRVCTAGIVYCFYLLIRYVILV